MTWHGGRATTVILARGGARAAAEMGALTLKEAVGMPVESLQTAQFRHGPLELAGPELAAMVIATEPETRDLDLGIADELRRLGAAVWTVTAGVAAHGRDRRRPARPPAHPRGGDRARAAARLAARDPRRARARRLRPRREGDDP